MTPGMIQATCRGGWSPCRYRQRTHAAVMASIGRLLRTPVARLGGGREAAGAMNTVAAATSLDNSAKARAAAASHRRLRQYRWMATSEKRSANRSWEPEAH